MKIGILTQPLRGNYGGVLQNWALQQVLIRLGHEPVTIDVLPYPNCYLFILSSLSRWLFGSFPLVRGSFGDGARGGIPYLSIL